MLLSIIVTGNFKTCLCTGSVRQRRKSGKLAEAPAVKKRNHGNQKAVPIFKTKCCFVQCRSAPLNPILNLCSSCSDNKVQNLSGGIGKATARFASIVILEALNTIS